MHVALVTHHRLPVRGYGGTQRVVVWLARALAELGHGVTVVAARGTRLPGLRVREAPARAFRRLYGDSEYDADELVPQDAQVVHFQAPIAARVPKPNLVTIHGNGPPGLYPPNAVFVSRDHMTRLDGRHFVYNGVDPSEYRFGAEKSDYYLFLGKAKWRVKGAGAAERIARRAEIRLVVAGGRRLRWSRKVRWVGTVDGGRKAELLAAARALLFPIQWEEPFGLVVAEAWMSGTPVLAAPRGSMRELVRPQVGRLCATEEEFVEAVGAIERGELTYDPRDCRAYAEERFSHLRMARDYLALYEQAIAERWGVR